MKGYTIGWKMKNDFYDRRQDLKFPLADLVQSLLGQTELPSAEVFWLLEI